MSWTEIGLMGLGILFALVIYLFYRVIRFHRELRHLKRTLYQIIGEETERPHSNGDGID